MTPNRQLHRTVNGGAALVPAGELMLAVWKSHVALSRLVRRSLRGRTTPTRSPRRYTCSRGYTPPNARQFSTASISLPATLFNSACTISLVGRSAVDCARRGTASRCPVSPGAP